MSKAIVMTLPAVLIILDVYPLETAAGPVARVDDSGKPGRSGGEGSGTGRRHRHRDRRAATPSARTGHDRRAAPREPGGGGARTAWPSTLEELIPILIAPMYQLLAGQDPYDGPMLAARRE